MIETALFFIYSGAIWLYFIGVICLIFVFVEDGRPVIFWRFCLTVFCWPVMLPMLMLFYRKDKIGE